MDLAEDVLVAIKELLLRFKNIEQYKMIQINNVYEVRTYEKN